MFMEQNIRNLIEKRSLKRVAVGMVALLAMVFVGGRAQAQCDQLDGTSFTVNIITANTASLEIDWSMDDFNDSFNGTIALYFTNTTTSQTFRFEDNSGLFTTSNMPVGNYEWYFRGYCTGGDSTVVITGSDFYICDEGVTVTSITVTPDCNGNEGKIEISAICECDNNAVISYKLVDSGETNYTGHFEGLSGNEYYNFSISNEGNGLTVDTTIYVPEGSTCDITATGTPSLTILDYSYEDYENSGNFGEFYYRLEIPSVDGTPEAIEVQYGLVGSDSPSSVYYNPSTGSGSIKIPITAKGDWEVKMRARCCGGSFPGNIPGDWFLIDTIHHYPNFSIYTEGSCYRIPPAQSENGSAEISFIPPHSVSSNSSKMGIRVFPVDNPDNIKIDTVGDYGMAGGTIELSSLTEGEYKVSVYITDGLENYNNTYDAYLDTTFTVESRIKVTIQNDSSTFCATDSVLYRAIVTGGTEPYDFEWVAYETTFGQFDDSVWVNFDIASSDDPGVTVTDADGCFVETPIHVNLLPAYTQETDYYYDSYTYSRNRYIIASQLPFTLQDFTFDGSETSASHEFTFQTAKGCDSIVHIDFTQKPGIALPSSGNLDTTITTGVDVYDDGGFSSAAALHADRTLTLHAPEGNTLELQLTGRTFDLGEGEALYVYDYNGVNDNALLFEYRQGMNPPNMDFTSNSRSLTFRYVTGNSCAQGFIMTVNTKDISNECLPVYNVTYSLMSGGETYSYCNMHWEYSGVADSFEVKYAGLKWNDDTGNYDTVYGPYTRYEASGSTASQASCRNDLDAFGRVEIRAICGEGDTSEVTSFDWTPHQPLKIPASGDTIVTLDSTIFNINVYDAGGGSGNYGDNYNGSLIVKPADGYRLVISYSSQYNLESEYDYLYITDDYDGSAVNTYQIDTLTGEGSLSDTYDFHIYSRSGGFKFTLTSDVSNNNAGVELYLSQLKLDECLPSYNPKAERRLMDITTYYVITDAGIYGSTAGDRVVVKKTNVATSAIEYDTLTLEMWDNSIALSIEPQYTMDVQLAPLCGYGNATQWSDPMRLSACQMPYDIIDGGTTETSQQISWTGDASSYVVGYRVANTDEWNYVSTPDATTEITLTGLFPATTYEAKVASVCGDGDTSVFSDELQPVTFRTGCGYTPGLPDGNALTSIPDVLNFDLAESSLTYHYEMPDCWSRIETVVTDATDGTQKPYPHVTYTYIGHDQNQNRLEFYSNASDDQYAIMPPVILQDQASNWNIAFNASLEDTNCVYDGLYFLEFGVMTDPSDPTTFTTRKTVDLSTFNSDDVLYNFTESDVVGGDKIYPAFKVAKRIGWNFHHAHILLNSVKFVPTYGLTAPTNVHVAPHPTQDNNVVVSWDAVELQGSDRTSLQYSLSVQRNSNLIDINDTTIITTGTQVTVPAGEGVTVAASVSAMVNDAYYSAFSPWYSNPSDTVLYMVPLYDRQVADTIGDLSLANAENAGSDYPFQYGGNASGIMLISSSELQNVRTVSAIALLQAPDCGTSGWQNLEVYMKDVDVNSFSTTYTGTGYTIDNASDFTFTSTDRMWYNNVMVEPDNDGWLVIRPGDGDNTFNHDPEKNLMIGIAGWGGDYPEGTVRFMTDNSAAGDNMGLSLVGVDNVQNLQSMTLSSDPLVSRPLIMVIENKNCVGDTLVVDTNLCENATLEWRGQTIDLNASDAGLHFNSDLYRFIYYDTVPNAANGGTCDSIYMLRVTRKYNKYPDEDDRVNNCGPYTWHGTTYFHSNGEMVSVEVTPGCWETVWQGTDPITDTVRGVTSDGCDSIYTLNLTVEAYSTIIFDSTYADAGTGMSDRYVCTSSMTVPNCTMTRRYYDFGAWLYDGDTVWANETLQLTEDTIILQPLWEPACYNYTDSLMVVTDYEDFCMTNSSYTWHGHTVDFAYLRAHGYVLPTVWGDSYDTIYVDDTIVNAAGGVCDSIYRLRLTVGDRLMVTDYFSENADAVVCGAGYTWSDGNHYTADTGYFWWSDPDDSDHYSYANLNFNTAPYYIDSTTNAGCGTLHMLGIAVDDTVPGVTVTFIKYYQEYATSLDTLYSMTASVCEGVGYIVPDMPDSVTREGYRFDHWTDNPACGWTVDPGEEKVLSNEYLVFYGVWESTCSDVTVADTMTLCPNDTIEWYGYTWRSPEFSVGVYDTIVTHYGVIPGECDSIFHLNIAVPDIPTLSVGSVKNVSCSGDNDGEITVTVPTIVNIYDYNLTYQFKLDTSEYSTAINTNNYWWGQLMAGEHKVYLKDGCGLMDSTTVTITEPEQITVNIESYGGEAVCYSTVMGKQLDATATGGNGYYNYKWNNDATRTYDTLMVSLNVPGTFHDTVIVTDSNGCTGMGTYTYIVYDTLKVTINGGDTSYCKNAPSVPLTVTVTGGDTNGYTYQWSNYSPIDTATGPSFTVPTSGGSTVLYDNISVTVTNACGEKTAQGPVITVLDSIRMSPQVDDVSLCFGANIGQMEVDVQGGGAFTGQWYMNGTAVTDHNPGDADNKYTPRTDTAGTFNYSLKVTSNAGCGSDSVQVKNLTVYDTLVVTSLSSDTTICVWSSDTLRVSVAGGSGSYTYQWKKDDSDIADATQEFYRVWAEDADTSVYSVHVTDVNGCGDTTITIATVTIPEYITLTTSMVDTTYCYGAQAAPITLNPTGGDGTYTYQWIVANNDDMMGSETLSTTGNSHTPTTDSAASYYYRVTITSGVCSTERDVARIYVMDQVRINLTPDTSTICFGSEGTTYELTDHTDGGYYGDYTYQWYKNGEVLTGEEGDTYMPVGTTAGTFTYSAVATDEIGCHSDTTTVGVLTVYNEITAPTASTDTAFYCFGTAIPQLTSGITGGSGRFYYYWELDGEMLDENGATLTLDSAAGIYQYSVSIMDSAGCDGTAQTFQPIRIYEELRVGYNYAEAANGTDCSHTELDSIRAYPMGGSGDVTYQWYMDSVAIDGATGWFYRPSADSASYKFYHVVVTDANGCEQVNLGDGVYVSVVDSLRYSGHLEVPTTLCLGSTVTEANQIQVNTTGGAGTFYYRWYINGEPVADTATTTNVIMPSTDVAGTYSYSVQITAAACGADSVHIVDLTVKAPTTTYDTLAVCDSLRWIDDSLYTLVDEATGRINSQVSTYGLSHTVSDQYGCDSTVYLNLTLNPSGWFYEGRGGMAPDTNSYCYGSWIDIYTDSQNPDVFAYQWYRDGEAIADATGWRDSSLADTPGTHVYSLKVTPYSGCASDSAAVRVATIYEPFVVTSMQMDTAGCMEDTYLHLPFIDTNATGGSGNIFSNWYEIVGNDTIESNTVYMDSVGPGEYNFVMKETDTYGCGEGIAIYTTVTVAENYTASFVSNEDDSTTMSDISVCAIKGLVLPDNEFTYPNYNFVGWGTATAADTLQPGDTVYITGNTTYYTLWEFVCQNIDTTEIARICEGSTTTWHGYTVDGTVEAYVDTVTGVVNDLCDSIYHLQVEVGTPNEHDTTLTVCDSLTWNGTLYTETPDTTLVYVLANGNMYGCDSTDKLTLTVIYSGHEYEVVTACDSYTMDNTIYTESTDLPTITGEMPNGCPFYTHMSLTIHHSYYGDTSVTACVEYTWNDMTMRESGEQEFRGQTIEGCDSVVMLNLTINPATYGVDEQVVCDSLTWLDGNTYYDGFEADFNFITYTFEGANQYGCDSIVALGITMMEHIDVAFQSDYGEGWMDPTQTCENTPMVVPDCDYENPGYRFGGWLDVETGDTIQPGDTVTMENGRSYIAIWIPICNDAYVVTDTVMCTGDSLLWCGQLMAGDDLVSGSYEHVAYDVIENACDSIYMLRLTVYPTGHAEYYDTVHGEYMWNGEIYSTTGDYTVWVGRNRWGCDSLETLHLVVNLGIDDSDLDNMKLYPNPTRGDVNIEGVEVKKVEVLDMVGRTVATFEGSNHIDITDLPSGTYTLAITTMDDRLVTRRVAKR